MKAALKIPRLLADTVEENAYICKVSQDEEGAVTKLSNAGGKTHNLLGAQFFGDNPLLKRRATKPSSYLEARAQNEHIVFVNYQRDRKPRFCSVNLTNKKFSVIPESCRKDFESSVDFDDWNYFLELARKEEQPEFLRTVFRWRDLGGRAQRGDLIGALDSQQMASIWYAAIPSIVFEWAQGNLQEAISKQETNQWSLDDHFTLFEKVLDGVTFLHAQGMIHGDIRPANIMRIGSQEANTYRVGDYGSYGREWQAIAGNEPGGLTQIGPAIGRLRSTPFYAPERRAGIELESANVAIITRIRQRETSPYGYLLVLGWRANLVSDDGTVTDEIKREVEEIKATLGKKPLSTKDAKQVFATDQLQRGDRLRVRNYLFESIQVLKPDADHKFYVCTGRYADILHDHLIVYKQSGSIADWSVIDISNYVEFHQWSAATDLYGVGALCLYCLFSRGLQQRTVSKPSTTNGNIAAQTTGTSAKESGNPDHTTSETGTNGKNPDKQFAEMIHILESIPYFKFFWKELERFRREIETLYERDRKIPSPSTQSVEGTETGQTLYELALYTTNNVLQSTPKARVILEQFDRNLAHFLLFMHFVLACLHRESSMEPQAEDLKAARSFKPFAKDRVELPQENGAASKALRRLTKLKRLLAQPFFDDFKCKPEDEILDFNPRSDFQMRIESEKVRRKVREFLHSNVFKRNALRKELEALVASNDSEE